MKENIREDERRIWNVRGLRGKENEVVEVFERSNLHYLAITETKIDGKGKGKYNYGERARICIQWSK